ncbi:MAG TPA: protein-L-isoaspartate(D-aspartate) O-methyltransferase [Bacillota bacterium]|nr:protein-L-isoaspartate(D-aspartate) O-methyltransferase [Bacillota bacterium]
MKTKIAKKLLDDMISQQLVKRGISSPDVIEAFSHVQRHLFVPKIYQTEAYEDYPLDIGFEQTISQPYIVALMVEKANIKTTDRVLEIGTGSGYLTAILSELSAEVYTVEVIDELYERAKILLNHLGYDNIHYLNDNGYFGWQEFAPYDKIIVSAAAQYLPSYLVDQLKDGGKLIVPLETRGWQELFAMTKDPFGLHREKLCNCRFVPMVEGIPKNQN